MILFGEILTVAAAVVLVALVILYAKEISGE